MPTWFGDGVMASPALRALRGVDGCTRLTVAVREAFAPLYEGLPFVDAVLRLPERGSGRRVRRGEAARAGSTPRAGAAAVAQLRGGGFDTAVLLPNSFRAAWTAWRAGVKRRVGFDRDARGMLLTDRLVPARTPDGFTVVPAVDYYLQMAHYLGAPAGVDRRLVVATAEHDVDLARRLLEPARGRPVALLVPGAAAASKRWPPQSFAELAGRLHAEHGLAVAVAGAPDERETVARLAGAAPCRVIDLLKAGAGVEGLRAVMRASRLVVTNDTGPRHLAAALNVPTVTLFGPTDPRWTETGFAVERRVISTRPAASDAMRGVSVAAALAAAAGLLSDTQSSAAAAGHGAAAAATAGRA